MKTITKLTLGQMNKRSGITSKKRILDAASRVFSDYSYAGANIRMIAGAANISTGGLYLYFKNKEDICLTLMKSRMDDFSEKVMELVKDNSDPSKAIRTFIAVSLNYAQRHRDLSLVLRCEHGVSFGLEMKRRFFKRQRNLIENIVRQGIQSDTFRNVNVQETAQIILSIIRGFSLPTVVEPDSLFSPHECSELILKGLIRRNRK